MASFVVSTYWWGNRICENSKRDYLKVTNHPVSYKTLTLRLAYTCRRLGLDFYSEEYDARNNREGIIYKPLFIRKTVERFNKPVLYIDCDIYIHRFPGLIDATEHQYDFMAFNWYADTRVNAVFDWHTLHTNSDVLYFNYTQNALRFLNTWYDALLQNPYLTDDQLLEDCFIKYTHLLNYYWFPAEYFYLPQQMKCKLKPVLSHPFYKSTLTTERNQVYNHYTHILEYIKNKSILRYVKERNKGFKSAGLHYEYRFDPPHSSPFVVSCPSDSTNPSDHGTDSFHSSTNRLLRNE